MIDAKLITVMYVELLLFLILFPLIPALILTVLRNENLRAIVVTAGAGIRNNFV